MAKRWRGGSWSLLLLVVVLALLAGCAAPWAGRPLQETLPAEFAGTVPCAGCPAEAWRLTLFPDQLFVLRQTPVAESATSSDQFGRWLLSTDGRIVRLYGAETSPLTLRVASSGQLWLVRPEGDSALQRVRRSGAPAPLLELRGMYQPAADARTAARFQECRSGAALAVVPGEAAAEIAALHARERQAEAGGPAPLPITVAGRLDGDGRGGATRLQVERLVRHGPERDCDARIANAPLVGSQWQLVEVDGHRLPPGGQRPPFLRFDDAGAVAGFTGCNRLAGRYVVTGAVLTLSDLASTRMSCRGTAVLEQMFTQLLRSVARWRVIESTLELYDETGTLLGRFEAQPM